MAKGAHAHGAKEHLCGRCCNQYPIRRHSLMSPPRLNSLVCISLSVQHLLSSLIPLSANCLWALSLGALASLPQLGIMPSLAHWQIASAIPSCSASRVFISFAPKGKQWMCPTMHLQSPFDANVPFVSMPAGCGKTCTQQPVYQAQGSQSASRSCSIRKPLAPCLSTIRWHQGVGR